MNDTPASNNMRSRDESAEGTNKLIEIICSDDNAVRDKALDDQCADRTRTQLLEDADALEAFWRSSENLYHRVRSLFFLAAIHRYHLPPFFENDSPGRIPFDAHCHLLERRFVDAIDVLLAAQDEHGPSGALSSALYSAYHQLAVQTLADQVRKSVRSVSENVWMFGMDDPSQHPLKVREELLSFDPADSRPPVLKETTAVRMDFSHSGWSDIFFLGMDFPEGARVINASINLGVTGRDDQPHPPIECYLRVIDRPVLRLVSVDLKASAEVKSIGEVFDFGRDYLGLLKAAVIAAGVIPPGLEGCADSIESVLSVLVGEGRGIELVSKVNDIPKGSRLAVSTNLLSSLIAICMRATGQIDELVGGLKEDERRLIAARAILGEWLAGSGGGWQDSGGIWPGIKLIEGAEAREGDPEFGISRGRLLPHHTVFGDDFVSRETRQKLQDSLVLVHGGMAQNVGPVLEMVTEKYLLRSPAEWEARKEAISILDEILAALKAGDIRKVGSLTHRNFFGPLQKIIPLCTNLFTNELVERCREKWGDSFQGFWMLGGMAGGGMGFIFDPEIKNRAKTWLQTVITETKQSMEKRLPFAMNPVVYDFEINDRGTVSEIDTDGQMPFAYHQLMQPIWQRLEDSERSALMQSELDEAPSVVKLGSQTGSQLNEAGHGPSIDQLLEKIGFDSELHQQIREGLKTGDYGLAQNRLSPETAIEDVSSSDFVDARLEIAADTIAIGQNAIESGEVAIMSLAAGVGSRWTEGAGVVKGLHPFCQLSGRHRSFLEVHIAKSRKVAAQSPFAPPHVITTGYLTHDPINEYLSSVNNFDYPGTVLLSPGKYVGLRMVPMVRDLQFAWEEMPQQILDEQQQKMRESVRAALMGWARATGEASDYRDNLPLQCLHPVGHWYEIPNLLRNGTLKTLLDRHPGLKHLMLHNIDTLGANIDAGLLGLHIQSGRCLSFEVIPRKLEDRGGGLARVDGRVQLVEGLALPREEDEFNLSYYNTMTTWIDIDRMLEVFGLTRGQLGDANKIDEAVRTLGKRMPTYITIKDVKKRWGHGQEDIFPVSQFEKLWSDMSGLDDVSCGYFVVPLKRGQQLKEQSQLDGWLRDGTAEYVNSLCQW
ncbi:MAG: UTP--glucose-1-phosphate uridylyltransferase [Planctomycetota bacterium]